MSIHSCYVCSSKDHFDELMVKEMMQGTRTRFKYKYCLNCRSLSISELPDNPEYYYQNYYTGIKKYNKIKNLRSILWLWRSYFSINGGWPLIRLFAYNTILEWCYIAKIRPFHKILDVGCGNGDVLFEFSKNGFKNLYGVDPFPPDGFNKDFKWKFAIGDIFSVNETEFDLIMFNHSLEHVNNHREILHKAKSLLTKNGTIMIRMPLINKAFLDYRENWFQIDAPRHFLIHSLKSFETLIKDIDLMIYKTVFDSTESQFMGSEQYKEDIPLYAENSYKVNITKSIFSHNDLNRFKKKAKEYNKLKIGDQAAFFLTPKKS